MRCGHFRQLFARTVVGPAVAAAYDWQHQYPAIYRVIPSNVQVRPRHLYVHSVVVQVDTVGTVGNAVTVLEGASSYCNFTNVLNSLCLSDRLNAYYSRQPSINVLAIFLLTISMGQSRS